MGTRVKDIDKLTFIKTLKEANLTLLTAHDVRKLFKIDKENTLKHLLSRMIKAEVLKPLIKGKYLFLFSDRHPSDFEISNFLVVPSYISLESALSFWGVLSQFPYGITAVTPLKPRSLFIGGKEFVYSKIKKEFFLGYKRVDNFLIAEKEKAVFDYLYFVYKGLRAKSSIDELDLTTKTKRFLKKYACGKFAQFLKEYVGL